MFSVFTIPLKTINTYPYFTAKITSIKLFKIYHIHINIVICPVTHNLIDNIFNIIIIMNSCYLNDVSHQVLWIGYNIRNYQFLYSKRFCASLLQSMTFSSVYVMIPAVRRSFPTLFQVYLSTVFARPPVAIPSWRVSNSPLLWSSHSF